MRSFGFPELVVLIVLGLLIYFVRVALGARPRFGGIASRQCPHCAQQIPQIGMYCPFCGQRVV